MIAPEGMTRCGECDETIAPDDPVHQVHEDNNCTDPDWCYCDTLYVHAGCCRDCRPLAIPGQVSLLDPPLASTAGLPKLRSA